MLDGLGMAETTPGPLIMVLQFVGFMAAFRDPGALSPMLAGTLGGLLATWVTFTPCFLWIFLGAPFIETLRGNKGLAGALTAITAAVVGVILNLSIWFALHTVFRETSPVRSFGLSFDMPVLSSVDQCRAGAGDCGCDRDLPLQPGHADGAGRLVRRGRAAAAGRSDLRARREAVAYSTPRFELVRLRQAVGEAAGVGAVAAPVGNSFQLMLCSRPGGILPGQARLGIERRDVGQRAAGYFCKRTPRPRAISGT